MRVRMARDELRRIGELSQTIKALEAEIAGLVATIAPQLLSEPGFGPLTAAKLVGEIAGAQRFATAAKLARAAGVAPIPASSGDTQRQRLDQGGNRQINAALHRVIVTRARCHPPNPGLHRPPPRRRQDDPRSHPLPQALPRPPRLATPATRSQKHRHHHQFLDIEATRAAAPARCRLRADADATSATSASRERCSRGLRGRSVEHEARRRPRRRATGSRSAVGHRRVHCRGHPAVGRRVARRWARRDHLGQDRPTGLRSPVAPAVRGHQAAADARRLSAAVPCTDATADAARLHEPQCSVEAHARAATQASVTATRPMMCRSGWWQRLGAHRRAYCHEVGCGAPYLVSTTDGTDFR